MLVFDEICVVLLRDAPVACVAVPLISRASTDTTLIHHYWVGTGDALPNSSVTLPLVLIGGALLAFHEELAKAWIAKRKSLSKGVLLDGFESYWTLAFATRRDLGVI